MAFRVIQGALSVIVTQIRTLASLGSEVDRLHFLLVCVESMVPEVSRRGRGVMETFFVQYDLHVVCRPCKQSVTLAPLQPSSPH